jgi:hypothetical protein
MYRMKPSEEETFSKVLKRRRVTTPGNPARSKWSEHEDRPRDETSAEGPQPQPVATTP